MPLRLVWDKSMSSRGTEKGNLERRGNTVHGSVEGRVAITLLCMYSRVTASTEEGEEDTRVSDGLGLCVFGYVPR